MLKEWYQKIINPDYEQEKLLNFVHQFIQPKAKIVDIGCGYGRYLIPLKQAGYDVVGIEQNQHIVQHNVAQGLNCLTPDDFKQDNRKFDAIICSHIIEHFTPNDLFVFLNEHLAKLKENGYLFIATPLYSDHFYDDFDHVKPYHPLGLQMVFGKQKAQVQYYSNHHLTLQDIWFRKSPYFVSFHRAKYFKSCLSRSLQCYDLLLAILYRASGGWLGKKDGWVGVFQKRERLS